jgi:hypothetical protein
MWRLLVIPWLWTVGRTLVGLRQPTTPLSPSQTPLPPATPLRLANVTTPEPQAQLREAAKFFAASFEIRQLPVCFAAGAGDKSADIATPVR